MESWNDQEHHINSRNDVILRVRQLNHCLRKACGAAIPRKHNTPKTVPWWDGNLSILQKKAYKTRRAFQREKDIDKRQQLYTIYKKAKSTYTSTVTSTKNGKWKEFVTITGNQNPWSFIYKLQTDKIKYRRIANNIKINGEYTIDWASTNKAMLDQLFPMDSEIGETEEQQTIRQENQTIPEGETEQFTMEELIATINKMRPGKAPGLTASH